MEARALTRAALAARLGVSAQMVGYWRSGVCLPTPYFADILADLLDDARLRQMVKVARTVRCPCGVTFDREQTKRLYCSYTCQRRAHVRGGVRAPDQRQRAIDAMCHGCEPEGTCRDDGCALRPFSPFLYVPARRVA